MALIRCDFFSEALELSTSMTVLLPQSSSAQIGVTGRDVTEPPPVLYLLHGLTDDDTAWTRYTSIERYASDYGLAVVMPQVHRSFYADETYGMKFWTFLSEELPAIVASFFRVSNRRSDTFVAGLSMGGYGAFRWALRQPERFAAAASLSGALDAAYVQEYDMRPHIRALAARVFAGRTVQHTDEDLMHLVKNADPDTLPRTGPKLMMAAGMAVTAIGMLLLSRLQVDSGYAGGVLPALLVTGVGLAFVFAPAMNASTSGVQHEDAGVASALVNVGQQVGGSIGTALLSTLAVDASRDYLTGRAPTPAVLAEAALHSYTTAFTAAAVIFGIGAVVSGLLLRPGPLPQTDADPVALAA